MAALAVIGCTRKVEVTTAPSSTGVAVVAPVTIAATNASYAPGESVALRVSNQSQSTWGYNACTRTLERDTGDGRWVKHDEGNRICTLMLALLGPAESRTERTNLPASLPAGRYRITIAFSDQRPTPTGQAPGVLASTQAFAVR